MARAEGPKGGFMRYRFAAAAAAICCLSLSGAQAHAQTGGETPSFLSLRAENANGRRGPGTEHRIDWIYHRAGLPMMVTGESGPWRRVRDPDGAEVWMHMQNLDAHQTGYVRTAIELRHQPRANSGVKARLEPGVIGALTGCENGFARLAVRGRVGWVDAAAIWGAEACAGANQAQLALR